MPVTEPIILQMQLKGGQLFIHYRFYHYLAITMRAI